MFLKLSIYLKKTFGKFLHYTAGMYAGNLGFI